MVKIGVLVSGGGTNLQQLIDAQAAGRLGGGEIVTVISSKPEEIGRASCRERVS